MSKGVPFKNDSIDFQFGLVSFEFPQIEIPEHSNKISLEEEMSLRHEFSPLSERGESWTVFVLLFALVIMAFLKVSKTKRLSQFLESFYSNRFVDQLIREEGLLGSVVNLYLLVLSVLTSSLFAYQLIRIYFAERQITDIVDPQFFWFCIFSVAGYFLMKVIFYGLSSLLLSLKEKFSEYLFQYFLFFQVTGLLLFPIVLGIEFLDQVSSSTIATIGIGVVILLFTIRQVKIFYLGLVTTSFSPFYIILYICTLEILPLVVLSRFILNNVALL